MADLIKNNGVSVHQLKSILSDRMKQNVEGYALYQQLKDNQGNPISATNGLPVTGTVTSHSLFFSKSPQLAAHTIPFKASKLLIFQ